MTVKELIHQLQRFNPDLPVYLGDWNEEWVEDRPATAEDVQMLPALRYKRYVYPDVDLPERIVIGVGFTK